MLRAKIIGTQTTTPYFILTPIGFRSGEVGVYRIKTTDVGAITGFIIDKPNLSKSCSISYMKLAY